MFLAGLVHLMAITFVVMVVFNALGGSGYEGMGCFVYIVLQTN